ncbi:MAG TPA: 3-oxoacyl-[acyl-carrier-protein] synthase III C-terminal domain-containing protein [Saprospiraceae bacterium]|nr:3-oxoacyl-[acyl-carrier-protein] synthase III C-terminal domain-containing protein [Saprospiraceae bacterium]
MKSKIVHVSKALPSFTKSTPEIIPYVEQWLSSQEDRLRRKAIKIFENSGIDRRYSIMPAEEVFKDRNFGEKNDIYIRGARILANEALRKALDKADWEANSLDAIITVSCTGIMIPSVDAFLINDFEMKQDITRLPVTEMGCAAGISGMIYADQYLRANPGSRVAVIAVESPLSTFQLRDFSMVNIVSAAIFGDGAACVLMSSEEDTVGPTILDQQMYHFYNAERMMGFDLRDRGLHMVLDPSVPETIRDHFPDIIHPFLDRSGLNIEDVDHLVFHPGGRKIVQTVDDLFGQLGKSIEDTREVLRLYGNMSSATVLFVLERFMNRSPQQGEKGLMLSFGPGFSAQRILIEW